MKRNAAAEAAAVGEATTDDTATDETATDETKTRQRDNRSRAKKDQTTRSGTGPQQKVFAECPRSKNHKGARVYNTGEPFKSRTGDWVQRRYCICDSCGERWFQDGPVADKSKIPAENE